MANAVSVHDVASYILSKKSPLSVMKLQKLLYYSQAWSLVWDDAPLFYERIEAWAYGPVVPSAYDAHKGMFNVSDWPRGDARTLSSYQRDTVDAVLVFYGDKTAQWLSDLTHAEAPWRDARAGVSPTERSNREITLEAMAEYYGSLPDPATGG